VQQQPFIAKLSNDHAGPMGLTAQSHPDTPPQNARLLTAIKEIEAKAI
jgi:hypothetical protein